MSRLVAYSEMSQVEARPVQDRRMTSQKVCTSHYDVERLTVSGPKTCVEGNDAPSVTGSVV